MAEILSINGAEVKIGMEGGKIATVPIASLQFANPQVGDQVEVYQDGKEYIVKKTASAGACADGEGKSINKHVFVWVGNFLFGVFKLLLSLLGWIPFGIGTIAVWIWVLVDWIISMTKAYGSAYRGTENLTFDAEGHYAR